MSIRAANPGDAPTILRFIQELADYEKEPDAVEVTADVLRAQMESERAPFECLIAEEGGEPVGFALFFQTYSTWRGKPGLWLEDLYVTPAARGNGHGAALFKRLGQLCIERDYARLELCALDWNEPALAFYRSWNATPMSEWTTWRLDGEALQRLAAS
ncbi:MAG: GNAT family N-acetyltransferase [Deltaproteobacteria bacterium]|nr:GNAT family N-acetyltransferase [Deltaproteobacteria bacterium]